MSSLPDHAMCDAPAPGLIRNLNSVQRRGLNDLSNETTVEVLSQLSYMQLLHCRQLCKRIQLLVDKTPLLQYIMEYNAARYPSDAIKPSGFLQALYSFRKVQRKYRRPDPALLARKVAITKLVPGFEEYDWCDRMNWRIVGDMLVSLYRTDDYFKLGLGILAIGPDIPDDRRFHALRLPEYYVNMHIDPTADLLVACHVTKYCFLSLATGQRHPKVQSRPGGDDGISMHRGTHRHQERLSLQGEWFLVHGSRLSKSDQCFVCHENFLYHWPTGRLVEQWLHHEEGNEQSYPGCLVGRYAIIPILKADHTYRLEAYLLPENCGENPRPVLVAIYHLPPVSFSFELSLLPAGSSRQHFIEIGGSPPSILNLNYAGVPQAYLRASTLVTEAIMRKDGDTEPLQYAWSEWGPPNICYLEGRNDQAVIGVSGLHLVYSDGIVDLNQYDIARDLYASLDASGRRLRNPDSTLNGPAEKNGLMMKLPYRFTQFHLPRPGRKPRYCLLEEEDGPKVVQIIEQQITGQLEALHYFSL